MGGSQSDAVTSDIEAGNIGKADIETPTRGCGFQIIIEANCGGVVKQEMGVDLRKPEGKARKNYL